MVTTIPLGIRHTSTDLFYLLLVDEQGVTHAHMSSFDAYAASCLARLTKTGHVVLPLCQLFTVLFGAKTTDGEGPLTCIECMMRLNNYKSATVIKLVEPIKILES